MSKGYTATYVRKLLKRHKDPLKQRIAELEAQVEVLGYQTKRLQELVDEQDKHITKLEEDTK